MRAAERGDTAASSELGSAADRRERRQSEIAALDARLRHLIGVFGDGGPVPDVLRDECVRLDAQRRDLMLELEGLDRRIDDLRSRIVDLGAVGASLGTLTERHLTLGRADLKAMLGTLVTAVTVAGGEQPERRKAPAGAGASEGQIPTRCVRVNIGVAGSPTGSGVFTPLRLVGIRKASGSPNPTMGRTRFAGLCFGC